MPIHVYIKLFLDYIEVRTVGDSLFLRHSKENVISLLHIREFQTSFTLLYLCCTKENVISLLPCG
jgi:hypothetical protein